MALACSRILTNGLRYQLRSNMIIPARSVLIKAEPAKDVPYEGHDNRNMKLGRPMSPHITIYAFPVPAMTSITHRITGMALAGYVMGLGSASLVLPNDMTHYLTMLEGLNMAPATLFVLKTILAFPFAYHLVNGIRHLIWDTGKYLTLKEVYTTSNVVFALTAVLTIALACL